MRIKPLKALLQSSSKLPPPAPREQTSGSTNRPPSRIDRRYGERTGRKAYYGARVQDWFKAALEERAAALTVERARSGRNGGSKQRVTQGELLEIMMQCLDLLGEVGPEEQKLLSRIAAKMKIDEADVFVTLIAEKGRALGILDEEGNVIG